MGRFVGLVIASVLAVGSFAQADGGLFACTSLDGKKKIATLEMRQDANHKLYISWIRDQAEQRFGGLTKAVTVKDKESGFSFSGTSFSYRDGSIDGFVTHSLILQPAVLNGTAYKGYVAEKIDIKGPEADRSRQTIFLCER